MPSFERLATAGPLPARVVRDQSLGALRMRLLSDCCESDGFANSVDLKGHLDTLEVSSTHPTEAPSLCDSIMETRCNTPDASIALSPACVYREEGSGELRLRLLGSCRQETSFSPIASANAGNGEAQPIEFESLHVVRGECRVAESTDALMEVQEQPKTTLMLRNLPQGFTRATLEELLDLEGFATRYDFLYMPAQLATGACFGYALINMVTPIDAKVFIAHFDGFQSWPLPSDKRAEAHISEELQGLSDQLERYRNSPLMHPSIPEVLRPALYKNGQRVAFPPPTKELKLPRMRSSARNSKRGS